MDSARFGASLNTVAKNDWAVAGKLPRSAAFNDGLASGRILVRMRPMNGGPQRTKQRLGMTTWWFW